MGVLRATIESVFYGGNISTEISKWYVVQMKINDFYKKITHLFIKWVVDQISSA